MSNFAAIFRITIIMRKHLSAILYIAILLVIAFLVFYLSFVAVVISSCLGVDSQRVEAVLGVPFGVMDVPAGNYSGIVRLGGNR